MQTATERYFMSNEQEDAAKWQMFKRYKELVSKRATIRQQLQQWSQVLRGVFQVLDNPPSVPTNELYLEQYPSKDDIHRATQEMHSLTTQINTLKTNLRQAGMDDLE